MFESRLQSDDVRLRRGRNNVQPNQPNQSNQSEKRPLSKVLKKNLHQYLINSTLHGLKYVGDRTITRFER